MVNKVICNKLNLFTLGLIVMTSCTSRNQSDVIVELDSTTIKIQVNEIKENSQLRYSDIYSTVEYVELESSEKSVIGKIDKLEITKFNDFVVFDEANGKILRFDSKGKYLNDIGMMGHSSNEYIHPELMAYDEFNDRVIVYDGAKKNLLHYNLLGDIVVVTPLHKYIADFSIINDSTLAIFANYRDFLEEKQIAYNLELISHEGQILRQYDPYSKEKENYRPAPNNTLLHYDGKVMYHKYYTPTFYSLNQDSLNPKYYIDFMSKQIPRKWLNCNNERDIDKLIFDKNSNVAYCKVLYNSPQKYILIASTNSSIITFFIDKTDTSKQIYGNVMFNDISGLLPSYIECYKNGKTYGVINPEIVKNFHTILNNDNSFKDYKLYLEEQNYYILDKDTSVVNSLSNNSNPIIQICTIK